MSKYQNNEVVLRVATKYGVEPSTLFPLLKATAFKQKNGIDPTDEQVLSILIVADMFNLNPFANEIYAVPNEGDVIPVVGVDGWAKVVNNQPQFDGVEFEYAQEMVMMPGALVEAPMWIDCVVHRKDRSKPIRVREYLDEVYQLPQCIYDPKGNEIFVPGHWQTHTKRQLRHKGFVQANRIAFGLTGIYDPDEANRIKASSLPVASQALLQQAATMVTEAEVVAHIKEDADVRDAEVSNTTDATDHEALVFEDDIEFEVGDNAEAIAKSNAYAEELAAKAEMEADAQAEARAAKTEAKVEAKVEAKAKAKVTKEAKAADADDVLRKQLAKLIQMAKDRNMWLPAFDYVKAKYAKNPELLQIAVSLIEEAKNEAERTEVEASSQAVSEETVEQDVKIDVATEAVTEDSDEFF